MDKDIIAQLEQLETELSTYVIDPTILKDGASSAFGICLRSIYNILNNAAKRDDLIYIPIPAQDVRDAIAKRGYDIAEFPPRAQMNIARKIAAYIHREYLHRQFNDLAKEFIEEEL